MTRCFSLFAPPPPPRRGAPGRCGPPDFSRGHAVSSHAVPRKIYDTSVGPLCARRIDLRSIRHLCLVVLRVDVDELRQVPRRDLGVESLFEGEA